MLRYLTTSKSSLKMNFTFFTLRKNFSKFFTKEHEWLNVEKGVATVGITDYAQSELGEIVHADLPKVGDRVKHGDTLGAVESVKTAADIYSPVEGTVSEVNEKLQKTPKLLNTHAESQGWYAKLKVDEAQITKDLEGFMNEEQYHKYVQEIKK